MLLETPAFELSVPVDRFNQSMQLIPVHRTASSQQTDDVSPGAVQIPNEWVDAGVVSCAAFSSSLPAQWPSAASPSG